MKDVDAKKLNTYIQNFKSFYALNTPRFVWKNKLSKFKSKEKSSYAQLYDKLQ